MKSKRRVYRAPTKKTAGAYQPRSRPATHPPSFIRFEKPRIVGEFRKLINELEKAR